MESLKEQENRSEKLLSLLDQLQRNPIDYAKNFSLIAEEVRGKKTPLEVPSIKEVRQCFNSFLHYKKSQFESVLKYWNRRHMTVLLFLLAYFKDQTSLSPSQYDDYHWHSLSQYLPFTTPESLKYKWLSLQHKSQNYPNFWTVKDDYTLMETVYEKANVLLDPSKASSVKVKWSAIAMRFNFLSRNNKLGKHCKERWFNHLNPLLNKAVWTDQEDILLLENAIIHNKKWAKIAMDFPGRTQHNVKNRFLSLIAREHKISSKKLSFKESCSRIIILKTLCNLKKRFSLNSEKPLGGSNEETAETIGNKPETLLIMDSAGLENPWEVNQQNQPLQMYGEEKRKRDFLPHENAAIDFEKWEKNEEDCFGRKSEARTETKENDFFLESIEFFNI